MSSTPNTSNKAKLTSKVVALLGHFVTWFVMFPIFVVDTPNSTSACTYAVTFRSMRTSDNANTKAQVDSNKSMGFLMEIAQ